MFPFEDRANARQPEKFSVFRRHCGLPADIFSPPYNERKQQISGRKNDKEITNDRLEQATKEYATEHTKEKLTEVLNLLRPTKLLVPAMLQAPDKPAPCFLKSNSGEQYFVVYTSKAQMENSPKSQDLLSMPFPGVQQRGCK